MRPSYIPLLALALLATTATPGFTQSPAASVVLPAGSAVNMELSRPIWFATVKPGDLFYAETVNPTTLADQTIIPYGTYIEGTIDSFTKPTKKSSQALLHLEFNKIIFPNGYTVVLAKPTTRALVTVQVSTANDLLLDNGAPLTMTLRKPLTLSAADIAQSIPLAQAPTPGDFVPATLCRPTPGDPGDPGSPGTPDITIPGSPGTPDITIPGADGAPDTVIPGSPATPDQVIPGTPATPATPPTPPTYCPVPPAVVSSVLEHGIHTATTHTATHPTSSTK